MKDSEENSINISYKYEGGCIDDDSMILDINSEESVKSKASLNDSIITILSEE